MLCFSRFSSEVPNSVNPLIKYLIFKEITIIIRINWTDSDVLTCRTVRGIAVVPLVVIYQYNKYSNWYLFCESITDQGQQRTIIHTYAKINVIMLLYFVFTFQYKEKEHVNSNVNTKYYNYYPKKTKYLCNFLIDNLRDQPKLSKQLY